ncbi:DgyrCDS9648 [Dimorphilus gyrociliatus]|uniref:DgyrCDS9648 n=1 Tax=Dimorphilus gyrociliatus TaxID=2664684 RepID=A0A7I8W0A7_9ANNE|nr:DgyrCDS9648 [Dimorphilus gyrociliatus]
MAPRSKRSKVRKDDSQQRKVSKFFALKYIGNVRHLYVKFQGSSYWKCDWIREEWIKKYSGCLYHHWKKDNPKPVTFNSHHSHIEMCRKLDLTTRLLVDRVVACRPNKDQPGEIEYFVKWRNCDLDEATWEDPNFLQANIPEFESILNDYILEIQKLTQDWSLPRKLVNPKDLRQEIIECPTYIRDMNLKKAHWNILNRLRKTCVERRIAVLERLPLPQRQKFIISLLKSIRADNIVGPVLMILPLPGMVSCWSEVIRRYMPGIRIRKFMGNKESREALWRYEFFHTITKPNRCKVPRFDIALTTGLIYSCDWRSLAICPWSVVLVDSITFSSNSSRLASHNILPGKFLTLLTTSVKLKEEENIELFEALELLDPKNIEIQRCLEALKDKNKKLYSEITPKYIINLQTEIVPKPLEFVFLIEMTSLQKYYYQKVTKQFINRKETFSSHSVKTYIDELRHCCNHPFLLDDHEGIHMIRSKSNDIATIIAASAKCQILLRLLRKMNPLEDRCLILCSSGPMLSVIGRVVRSQDYTCKYAYDGYRYYDRVVLLAFVGYFIIKNVLENKTERKVRTFCYLVCVDKDRVVLNPSASDTIILFDVDLERLRDIKILKLARKRGCTIYRMTCRNTIEESISKLIERKMLLHAIKHSGKHPYVRKILRSPWTDPLNFIGISHLLNSQIDDEFDKDILSLSNDDLQKIWTVGLFGHERVNRYLHPFPVCRPSDFTEEDISLLIRDELLETGKVLPFAKNEDFGHMFHQITLESSYEEEDRTFIFKKKPLWCKVSEKFEDTDKRINNFPAKELVSDTDLDIDFCDIDMIEPSIGNDMRPIEDAVVEKLIPTSDNQILQIKYLKDLRSICQEGFVLKLDDVETVTRGITKKAQLTALFKSRQTNV